MPDQIETGFDQLPEGAVPDNVDPKAKMSKAELRAAEIAEGKRLAELRKNDPPPGHPAEHLILDQYAELARIKLEEAAQRKAEDSAEESEAAKVNREIYQKIYDARNQPLPEPPKPQPVPQAIMDKTKLEIEAGRAAAARHVERPAEAALTPSDRRR